MPQSDVPGEKTWPTQPFPVKPPPLSRIAALTRDELTTVTPESRQRVRGDVRQGAKRRALHRAWARGDDLVSGHDGRRDVVGRRRRSGSRPVVRQHQRRRRRGADEGAAAGRAAGLSTRQPVGRVRAVLGLVEPAVPAAAVGPAARRGSGDGRHPLAGAAGRRAAAGGARHHRHRHAEHRRRHRDRQRPGVHRRHQRRQVPRL